MAARDHSHHLHVATDGDDSGPGTARLPFASLHRAQEAVRHLTETMHDDVVVELHGGTYVLDRPLRLWASAGDSGENGHRVVYEARGWGTGQPDHVVLSGGRRITGWVRDDAVGTWRADVGTLETRQLYVDGVRSQRARRAAGRALGLPGTVQADDGGYVTDSTEPQSWEHPSDIELVYRGHSGFAEPRCGVRSISGDRTSSRITMDQPGFRWFRRNHQGSWGDGPTGFGSKVRYEPPPPMWVENSRSFLTEPGTFHLDRTRPGDHVLRYMPRAHEDLERAEVVASALEHLVEGDGTAGAPLHDIVLRGLSFEHATWLGPELSTGFVQVFGPIYEGGDTAHAEDPWDSSESAQCVPGSIRFHHSERITIEGNRFTKLGGDALELSLACHDSVVRGNVICDVSGGGVSVGNRHPDTDLDEHNRNVEVANNLVFDIGVEYRGSIALYAEKTQGVLIAHNHISDVPYIGIALGEYWTHHPAGETTARDNRILRNHVVGAMRELDDGAGIFTTARQGSCYDDGAEVRGNLVHDIWGGNQEVPQPDGSLRTMGPDERYSFGLYADDDTDFVTWIANVVYRTAGDTISGCPLHTTFTQNYLEDTVAPGFWCTRGSRFVIFQNNVNLDNSDLERQLTELPGAARTVAEAGLEPRFRNIARWRVIARGGR